MPEKQHMQKIILSADSTCDLDEELKERYHVNYFPLHINLNGKDYLDNVDITPEQIYIMSFKEIHVTKASCTISCHCGPNTLGILFETL